MSKERDEVTLGALIKERNGYEQRLAAAKIAGDQQATVNKLEARIKDVDAELRLVGGTAEPRNKLIK